MSNLTPYLEELATQAHHEGGWGYSAGQVAHLEPTCLALLALSLEPAAFADALRQGRAALDHCAGPDGAYRVTMGREEATWPTALVLFVQSVLEYPEESQRLTAGNLLSLQGRVPDKAHLDDIHDIDL